MELQSKVIIMLAFRLVIVFLNVLKSELQSTFITILAHVYTSSEIFISSYDFELLSSVLSFLPTEL